MTSTFQVHRTYVSRYPAMYFITFKFNLYKICKICVVYLLFTEKEPRHQETKSFSLGHAVTEFVE